ncbi:peptide-N4-(N-acetyl-beta- glucosaminyl)asparagine amidase [Gamsiella multidivaricata]|nr:peptide-N4-(N-acetyl-beta- glucosaminyl)asparagine amidase [Gamsiella multidivaricata]
MDQQQISDLAQQLASQFAAMRPQRNQQASTATTNPAVNSGQPKTPSEADIAQLANRLGSLLHQEAGISSSVATQEAAADPFASVSDPSIYEKEFVDKFLRVNTAVLAYEDRQLLDQAYEQIPVDKFYEDIEVMAKEHPDDSTDDIVIRRLLHWFKNDYFVWVNEPPCVSCQASKRDMYMTRQTMSGPKFGANTNNDGSIVMHVKLHMTNRCFTPPAGASH